MTPTLSAGERVFVNKAAYWFSRPQRGDLVVVRDPRDMDRLLLKRIDSIALGLDSLARTLMRV